MKHLNSLVILCILMILNTTDHSILKVKGLLLVVVVVVLS